MTKSDPDRRHGVHDEGMSNDECPSSGKGSKRGWIFFQLFFAYDSGCHRQRVKTLCR